MNPLVLKKRADDYVWGWCIALDQRASNTGPSKGSSIGGEARKEDGASTSQLGIKCESVGISMGTDKGCRLRTYINGLQLNHDDIRDFT